MHLYVSLVLIYSRNEYCEFEASTFGFFEAICFLHDHTSYLFSCLGIIVSWGWYII